MTHSITIDWLPSPTTVSGYNIYRGSGALGSESDVPLNNSPILTPSYTDYTVFPGQIYNYSVTSVLNGIESIESLEIVSTPVPFSPSPAVMDLGAAAGFGLLAASTITNVPGSGTVVTGDIGLYPGTSVTGFEDVKMSGSFHLADYVAGYAQSSLSAASVAGMAVTGGITMPADIGGQVLEPGVYKVASSLSITGTVILDGGSNPNAVWIFQIGTSLTTADNNSSVALMGGAQASNVFWIVGSSATLGTYTTFAGNINAYASVTVKTGAHVLGQIGARTGAITLDANSCISFGECFGPLPPSPTNTPPPAPAAPTGIFIAGEN